MIEVFLFGIVLSLIPITLAGLFVTAYLHFFLHWALSLTKY